MWHLFSDVSGIQANLLFEYFDKSINDSFIEGDTIQNGNWS